jgi:hypothetical protein
MSPGNYRRDQRSSTLGRLPLLLLLPGGAAGSLRCTMPKARRDRGEARSVRLVNQPEQVPSIRQAAAVCNVTPPVVRRWLPLGLILGPPRRGERRFRYPHRSGGDRARHFGGLAQRLPLHPLSSGAERQAKRIRESPSAKPDASEGAAAAPGCDLRWSTISDGAPRPWPDF